MRASNGYSVRQGTILLVAFRMEASCSDVMGKLRLFLPRLTHSCASAASPFVVVLCCACVYGRACWVVQVGLASRPGWVVA